MIGFAVAVGMVVVAIFIIIFLAMSIKIIQPYEKGLKQKLGRYIGTLEPGVHFIIPMIEEVIVVNMREQVRDVEPQEVICQDNVVVTADAVVFFHPTEAKKAVYSIQNYKVAVTTLAKTMLRAIIGEMKLDEILSGRDKINATLCTQLDKETDKWGVRVTKVEVQKVDPPKDITEAMSRQMKAERGRRAAQLDATGRFEAAEQDKKAAIQKAEGIKQASILEAEGKAKAFELINKTFIGNAQLLKKLDVTETSLKDNAKIVLTEKGIQPVIVLGEEKVLPIRKGK